MARQQKQAAVEASAPAVPVRSLFERVAGHLDANDWTYTANEEKQYFSTGCRLKDASVRVILDVHASEDWQRVLVYSLFPVFVPENRRAAVAESINRFNYGMICGNLEMDAADGEVRIRLPARSRLLTSRTTAICRELRIQRKATTGASSATYAHWPGFVTKTLPPNPCVFDARFPIRSLAHFARVRRPRGI